MSYILKRILVGSTLCFFMLVSIPLISATDYIYPPEKGPYRVSIVGVCYGGDQMPYVYLKPDIGVKIGHFYWMHEKEYPYFGVSFDFMNNTIFKINGTQQNDALTHQTQIYLYQFKGWGPNMGLQLMLKLFLRYNLKLPIFTRIYGICSSIEVYIY